MFKFSQIGLLPVGLALLLCACTSSSDSASKGASGSTGNGSGGVRDNSGGADAASGATDVGVGGADSNAGGADASSGGTDANTGGTGSGTGGTTVVDPNACNDFPIDAPEVAATAVPLAPGELRPMPDGGTIVDGTYFLTAHESYGLDPDDIAAATYRTVIVISGAELQLAQIKNGSETRVTFAVTTTDKKFHAATTCPGPGQSLDYDSYTATSDQLVLFDDEKVVTLTLQE